MTAAEARAIVRDMHRRGVITAGELRDALSEIERGRGASAVASLRRQIAG